MRDCNSINIPIKTWNFIDIHKVDNYKEANLKVYQQFIEKLMYLSYKTRPDITFIVGQLNR